MTLLDETAAILSLDEKLASWRGTYWIDDAWVRILKSKPQSSLLRGLVAAGDVGFEHVVQVARRLREAGELNEVPQFVGDETLDGGLRAMVLEALSIEHVRAEATIVVEAVALGLESNSDEVAFAAVAALPLLPTHRRLHLAATAERLAGTTKDIDVRRAALTFLRSL